MPTNALMGQGAPQPQPQPQPQQQTAPAPTHLQTVAALRHFDLIERELTGLLADPDLGKADMKSKIIDGATKLVASGVMTPATAVIQLGQVPDRPFDQKVFLEKQLAETVQHANDVLDHHGAAFAGQDWNGPDYSTDDHQSIISGLAGHYNGLKPSNG
jgi:hypothetical protein